MRRPFIRGPGADMGQLILKSANASRPSGEWNDDDYDVLAEGIVVGRIMNAAACAGGHVMVVDARVRIPRGPHPDARLRGDARGRDGRVRQELAAGVRLACGREESTSSPPEKAANAKLRRA